MWFAGLGTVGLGVWMYMSDTLALAGEELAIVVLGIGGGLFLIGLCGFVSACKESVFGLRMFAILLFLIILCQVAAFIYGFSNQKASESFLSARWEELKPESREDIQREFDCCGWDESMPGDNCPDDVADDDYCWQLVKSTLDSERQIVLYVGIGILFLEILMFVCTMSLRYEVKATRQSTVMIYESQAPQMYNYQNQAQPVYSY